MAPFELNCEKEDDFDVYRKEHESDEHWNLRKSFLIFHRENFDSKQILVRNANLFMCIETLGCKYSDEILRETAELANQVPELRKYRESKQNMLKRQMINAVASAKLKYNKESPEFIQLKQHPVEMTDEIKLKSNQDKSDWSRMEKTFWSMDSRRKENEYNLTMLEHQYKFENRRNFLKDVVLFEDRNGLFDLAKTIVFIKKIGKFEQSYDDNEIGTYSYVFNGEVLAEGKGENKISAKKNADKALEIILRGYCYRIRSKFDSYSPDEHSENPKENNQALRMLQAFGFKGNLLDTKIIDHINFSIKVGRLGLENTNASFDKKYFDDLLKNYKSNPSEYDLIFTSEFTKDERAIIHQMAIRYNLRTKSVGKKKSRHLVITRISPQALRQRLLEGNDFLFHEKYEIFEPLIEKKKRKLL